MTVQFSIRRNAARWGWLAAAAALAATVPASTSAQGDQRAATPSANTSFRPGEIWRDTSGVPINAHGGGILLKDGVYYWFGEHKIAGEAGNRAHVGVHVYSSRDLLNWEDRGIALAVSEDPASEIVRESVIERPKVLFNRRTGKYVMWFHLELKGQGYKAARTGVAVADSPVGPYRYLGSVRPHAGIWPKNATAADKAPGTVLARDFAGGQMARDMTLFQDDDGKAYHFYTSEENHTLHIAELSPDYLKHSGRYVRVLPMGDNEAPAIFKTGGRYYMFASGLTGWAPNPAKSFVAKSIMGPWTPLGNPVRGSAEDAATTFRSQSTFVIEAPVRAKGGKKSYIFMADRWAPKNAIDGRYVWLPIEWENGKPILRWRDSWTMADLMGSRTSAAR